MADELYAESALNAEIAVIWDAADRAGDADYLICLRFDIEVNLATDATVWARLFSYGGGLCTGLCPWQPVHTELQ